MDRSLLRIARMACTFVALAGAAEARQADVVSVRAGEPLRGQITVAGYDGVEIRLAATGRARATLKLPWERVESVEFDSRPLEAAAVAEIEGRFDDARAQWTKLAEDARGRAPLRQEALFRLATLEQRLGRVEPALARWRELATEFPEGRHLDEAVKALIRGELAKGDPATANADLDRILEQSAAIASHPRFAAIQELLRGRVLEARTQWADARLHYGVAERASDLPAEDVARARLGSARCLLAEGRVADAEQRLRELVGPHADAATPGIVFAAAWNGLADLWRDRGVRERDRERLFQALYGYLRGVVLYVPQDGEPRTEHRRAIEGARRCCEAIAQLSTDPEEKALYRRRTAEFVRRLEWLDRR